MHVLEEKEVFKWLEFIPLKKIGKISFNVSSRKEIWTEINAGKITIKKKINKIKIIWGYK